MWKSESNCSYKKYLQKGRATLSSAPVKNDLKKTKSLFQAKIGSVSESEESGRYSTRIRAGRKKCHLQKDQLHQKSKANGGRVCSYSSNSIFSQMTMWCVFYTMTSRVSHITTTSSQMTVSLAGHGNSVTLGSLSLLSSSSYPAAADSCSLWKSSGTPTVKQPNQHQTTDKGSLTFSGRQKRNSEWMLMLLYICWMCTVNGQSEHVHQKSITGVKIHAVSQQRQLKLHNFFLALRKKIT